MDNITNNIIYTYTHKYEILVDFFETEISHSKDRMVKLTGLKIDGTSGFHL